MTSRVSTPGMATVSRLNSWSGSKAKTVAGSVPGRVWLTT